MDTTIASPSANGQLIGSKKGEVKIFSRTIAQRKIRILDQIECRQPQKDKKPDNIGDGGNKDA